MTDAKAIECAEALVKFCEDRDCVCDGCVFRKYDGKRSWGCNIGKIALDDVYDAREVRANFDKKNAGKDGIICLFCFNCGFRIAEIKMEKSGRQNIMDAVGDWEKHSAIKRCPRCGFPQFNRG